MANRRSQMKPKNWVNARELVALGRSIPSTSNRWPRCMHSNIEAYFAAKRSDITGTLASQAWLRHGKMNADSSDFNNEKCV